jgi:hypothetical protein
MHQTRTMSASAKAHWWNGNQFVATVVISTRLCSVGDISRRNSAW